MEFSDTLLVLLILQNGLVSSEDVRGRVGESFSIFHRFGFLNLGLKVLPSPEEDVIIEPTNPLFNQVFVSEEELSGAYEDEFHINFCSSPSELFSTYFEHFSVAGVQQTWRAFFAYEKRMAEIFLGIRAWHLMGDYRYALVRLYRKNKKITLLNSTRVVNPVYQPLFDNLQTQNDYFNLVDRVGSHYIDTIELGDFVYQVFVFDNFTYSYILHALNTTYVVTKNAQSFGKEYFNNWYVTYFGTLQAASSHARLNKLLKNDKFKIPRFIFGSYYSIFQLGKEDLRQEIEQYNTSMIIGMNLEPISDVLQDEETKEPFESWLLNSMQLWENFK